MEDPDGDGGPYEDLEDFLEEGEEEEEELISEPRASPTPSVQGSPGQHPDNPKPSN